MAEWFPSEEWLDAYRSNLAASERYRAESEGWSVEFEGDFVFEIRGLPTTERTLADLPDELGSRLRGSLAVMADERVADVVADPRPALAARLETVADAEPDASDRERLVDAMLGATIEEAPGLVGPDLDDVLDDDLTNLLGQLDDYVEDGTVRVYLDLHDGAVRSAEVLEPAAEPDPGFALRGPYGHWLDLVDGADAVESVLGEALELDGSVTTLIEYADAADEMGAVANRTPAKPLF